jgi:D-arabinose 1-dehydrogenase-like Zn-dependent alcohol dehydrogenase
VFTVVRRLPDGLHILDGEWPDIKYPINAGHDVVGWEDTVKFRSGRIIGAAVLQP